MSRLRIEHKTVYRYRQNVTFGQHRLVLRPREGHDLRVENMTINVSPAHRLQWARDVYNNSVALVDFLEAASELVIDSTVIVNRSLPFPSQQSVRLHTTNGSIAYDVIEAPLVSAYQAVSYPDDVIEVRSWLQQLPATHDPQEMLLQLCSLINRQVQYQRRSSKGVQTPAETLRLASGSCRDMATLMMDATRILGFASRFASGYLDCPASEAGRASTHAWAEIYLPILGWQGYDPTLGAATSLKHIAIGVSQHPRGVMPISGDFRGMTGDYLDLTVTVKIERIEATNS